MCGNVGWRGWYPVGAPPAPDHHPDGTLAADGSSPAAVPGSTVTALWNPNHDANGRPFHLDLFLTDTNGTVRSTFWTAGTGADDGWTHDAQVVGQGPSLPTRHGGWFAIGPIGLAKPGQPVTALWRNDHHLDLFLTSATGQVISNYWEPGIGWQQWFPVAGSTAGQATPGQPVTSLWSPGTDPNHLDVFAVDHAGAVISTFFDADAWRNGWFAIPSNPLGIAQPGQEITALWRNDHHLDLFMANANGQVVSDFWEPGPSWQSWFPVAGSQPSFVVPGQPVTALWNPGSDHHHLDVFTVTATGQVWSTFFDNDTWRSGWFAIPASVIPGPAAQQPQSVTAEWANPDQLDLFTSNSERQVISTMWLYSTGWQPWFTI
jgi:hypothetical protein